MDVTSTEVSRREAHETLSALAAGKCGRIPPDQLASHVLSLYPEAPWPVQRAALEACLRRVASARKDGLRVGSRPGDGLLGVYGTRADRKPRPYTTVLFSFEPWHGSCDCPDFHRNGLGLCKHLLLVLDALYGKPRTAERARRSEVSPGQHPRLDLDPVRPLTGQGDWLGQVRWVGGGRPAKLARSFAGANGQPSALKVPASRTARRKLVAELLATVRRDRARRLPHPGLQALLDEELERLDAGAHRTSGLSRLLSGMKRSLYPYQREAVARLVQNGRLLLADDMGLGKTAQAIGACHALWKAGQVRRGLLIVPAALKFQWEREWRAFTDVPVTVLDGSQAERHAVYAARKPGFVIANYEQLFRDLEDVLEFAPDLVALDEAQRIKNWQTKTARYVKRLSPRYRLVLSGTPFENRLDELASLFDWIDDRALEPKWRLDPVHSQRQDGSQEVLGVQHLDTLRARMAPVLLRRRRSEVLDQLPPRTDRVVPVRLTERQWAAHVELDQPIAALVARARKRPLTQAEFLRLMTLLTTQRVISNGMAQLNFESLWPSLEAQEPADPAVLEGLDMPKLQELRELVQHLVIEQGRKMVVFSQWRRALRLSNWAISDLLQAAGLRAGFFSGEESAARRTQNVVEFHDDPSFAVLFCTDAGGVGLNLQRAANCVVNLELPWNPAVLEQRVARIHRLGQTDPIDVVHLMGEGSIEARIHKLVSQKKAVFDQIFDGTSDAVHFDAAASLVERLGEMMPLRGADAEDEEETVGDLGPEAPLSDAVESAVQRASRDDAPGATSPPDVQALFKQLHVDARADGSLHIEASGEAARSLGALLRGLADVLEKGQGAEQERTR